MDKAVLEAVLLVAGGTLAALWAALWTQAVAWPDVPRPENWWSPAFDGPQDDWHRNRRVEGEEADVCGGGGEEGDGWNAMSVGLGEKTRETEVSGAFLSPFFGPLARAANVLLPGNFAAGGVLTSLDC